MSAQSLADFLGVKDPINPQDVVPEVDLCDLTGEDFARAVVTSYEYRASILRRVLLDELPPAIEARLLDYAWGKPAERVEHTGKNGGPIEITKIERVVVYPDAAHVFEESHGENSNSDTTH